jgi:hypothetical protein
VHGPAPHAVKCPENEVSVQTNLLASYVVTKSAGPHTPSSAGGGVGSRGKMARATGRTAAQADGHGGRL